MGKESQTQAKVQCMRGTDNQNLCPPIMGCYTHWTFWGLLHASGSALFPALYVSQHVQAQPSLCTTHLQRQEVGPHLQARVLRLHIKHTCVHLIYVYIYL